MIAADLRKRRPKPDTTWHFDEVYRADYFGRQRAARRGDADKRAPRWLKASLAKRLKSDIALYPGELVIYRLSDFADCMGVTPVQARNNVQTVLANESAQELRVASHHVCGEIEGAVGNQFGLFF
jgi:hypothetical protein